MIRQAMLAILLAGVGMALAADLEIKTVESGGRVYRPVAPPGDATVAHWKFAGTPGQLTETGEKIKDVKGRAAAVFGHPMYRSVDGVSGLEFNAGADRLFIEDDPAFALTGGLTLEAVIRCDGVAPGSQFQNQIVFRGDDRPGLDPWFLAVRLDGRLMFSVQDANNQYAQLFSPQPLPVGRTVHVAGVLNAESNEMELFVNGKRVAYGETNIRPLAELDRSALPGVSIGNVQSATYPEGFNGLIAEVRISNRALLPSELLRPGKASHKASRNRKQIEAPLLAR